MSTKLFSLFFFFKPIKTHLFVLHPCQIWSCFLVYFYISSFFFFFFIICDVQNGRNMSNKAFMETPSKAHNTNVHKFRIEMRYLIIVQVCKCIIWVYVFNLRYVPHFKVMFFFLKTILCHNQMRIFAN